MGEPLNFPDSAPHHFAAALVAKGAFEKQLKLFTDLTGEGKVLWKVTRPSRICNNPRLKYKKISTNLVDLEILPCHNTHLPRLKEPSFDMETSSPFQNLFGKSPFKALQQHMRKVSECTDQLPALVAALVAGQGEQANTISLRMHDQEKEAEAMKNDLFLHLPKSLFMPVDRRDLLAILNLNDEVADQCLRVANQIMAPGPVVPAPIHEGLQTASKKCSAVVASSRSIMENMDELVETGFGGREAKLVLGLLEELAASKKEAEQALQEVSNALFDEKSAIPPLSVVFWSRLLDELAKMPAAAAKAGDRVRLLLAR